jgi:hypothetical protein
MQYGLFSPSQAEITAQNARYPYIAKSVWIGCVEWTFNGSMNTTTLSEQRHINSSKMGPLK